MFLNRIEDASSPEDKALANSISKIKNWQDMQITYERVNAGFTNFNYLVYIEELKLKCFAKVVGPGSEAFIDREVAHEAAVSAHDVGVGPEILAYIKEDDFEVYEFLEGYKCFTISDMINPSLASKVMSCYAKVHSCDPLCRSNPWHKQINDLKRQVIEKNADMSPDLNYLIWHFNRAEKVLSMNDSELVPCYNDGYVTNYMKNEFGEVKIIDWEYGANNDPYWDVATYFFESFADKKTRRRLLKDYNPLASESEIAKVEVFIPLICLKWGLWASLQSSISQIKFDYLKYADILFMRAKHLIDQEVWEDSLSQFY